MTSLTGTFDHPNQYSDVVLLQPGGTAYFTLDNTGGNDWIVHLQRFTEGHQGTQTLAVYDSDVANGTYVNRFDRAIEVRFACLVLDDDPDSDTVDYTLLNTTPVTAADAEVVKIVHVASAKAGATAGWVVNAGNNLGTLATLPKAITAGTLVVRLSGYSIGDRIIGCYVVGSAQATTAQHTTLLVDLRSLTTAAAGSTDASLTDLAIEVDVVVDTVLGSSNTQVDAVDHVVADGESFYALLTATTANDNACTMTIQSVVLQVVPA